VSPAVTPSIPPSSIRRVGLVFSGGPAPGANAVISAVAISLMDAGVEVVGFFHGYSNLEIYHPVARRLVPDQHYRILHARDVGGLRNERGVLIGTARANPGKEVKTAADLDDPKKNEKLRNVYSALVDLEIDALVSIGGDDTLKTANFLYAMQRNLPEGARRVRVVHVPKTIDNDYGGIDFTTAASTSRSASSPRSTSSRKKC
jgi:6-phosphofructokinase 1